MENKINSLTAWLWIGFTVLLAVTLAVNGVQSLLGHAKFAYWHIPTLAIGCCFSLSFMTDKQKARALAFLRLTRKRLRSHILVQSPRRLCSRPPFFSFRPFNRPQTEP